jgi:hypothetical protein
MGRLAGAPHPLADLDVAELVLNEQTRDEYLNVAAGLAVLAGIAGSDTICAVRVGQISS